MYILPFGAQMTDLDLRAPDDRSKRPRIEIFAKIHELAKADDWSERN